MDIWTQQRQNLATAEYYRRAEPAEDKPIGTTVSGEPYYDGDEIVYLDDGVHLYDELTVSDLLAYIGAGVEIAERDF